ncbi:hypothetical protein [Xanthomonas axonopodis]|uniref:hypothetical protein n=1 Tax=Xanthomonas axonopodis TaxID=53413 RepID=UPI001C378F36|nr:hypothetical protein [Xanthomonas axonopodis]
MNAFHAGARSNRRQLERHTAQPAMMYLRHDPSASHWVKDAPSDISFKIPLKVIRQ